MNVPLAAIEDVSVGAWRIPTDGEEGAGTLERDATTLVDLPLATLLGRSHDEVPVYGSGGITGFPRAADPAAVHQLPVAAHTAPSPHLHACCAVSGRLAPLEYFHDHVRVETIAFDGVMQPEAGLLRPDLTRPGHGLSLRRAALSGYEVR